MRIFITGASGHIASAVIPELLDAGHDVVGLARSEASAEVVRSRGATPLLGELTDLDRLRSAAAAADGVIHLALFDDAALRSGDRAGAGAAGVRAVAAMGEALTGSGRPLVSAAAIGALGPLGRPSTEDDVAASEGATATEGVVLGLAEQDVRAVVVRLPLITHSRPDRRGLMGALIDASRRSGVSGFAGDGANRWPAVHSLDAGHLFCLALENAPAGTRWHAVQDEGVPVRQLADIIAARLNIPTAMIPGEQLNQHFGFVGGLIGLDLPATSTLTRERLGWNPTHDDLLSDLASDDFFTAQPEG